MTRLIDAEALIEVFKDNSNQELGYEWHWLNIIEAITNAPTIEANSGEAVGEVAYDYYPDGMPKGQYGVLTQSYMIGEGTKLYTSPQKREWVELTVQDVEDCLPDAVDYADDGAIRFSAQDIQNLAKAIQAKLKEVNYG